MEFILMLLSKKSIISTLALSLLVMAPAVAKKPESFLGKIGTSVLQTINEHSFLTGIALTQANIDYSNKIESLKNKVSTFGPDIQLQFDQLVDFITARVIEENPQQAGNKSAIKEATILYLAEKLNIADEPLLSNLEIALGITGILAISAVLFFVPGQGHFQL